MAQHEESPLVSGGAAHAGIRALKFGKDNGFRAELRRRVDEVLRSGGRRRRDCPQMYLKSAILLTVFAGSYILLVFFARNVWQGVGAAFLLMLSMAGIGFNIQHDGGHNAYSNRRWVNRLAAFTLDLLGSSSYYWRWKHAVIHHRFVNITGYDNDISLGAAGRMTPYQPHRPLHRWQHVYLWPLYAMDALKLQLLDDLRQLFKGGVGEHGVPRPHGWELVLFVTGKAMFVTWAFAIPLWFHPVWVVLLYYLLGTAVLGFTIVMVFLLPHCNSHASFPPPPGDGQIEVPWAEHQVRATLDFARNNPVLTWVLGGLNYHREHHLFPTICHVNYPVIFPVVEQTCRDFGISCQEHPTFASGIAAHYRWLKRMGKAETAPPPTSPPDQSLSGQTT